MRIGLIALLFAALANGADRQVAITIDDLPRGGDGGSRSAAELVSMTERLLRPFREEHIPLTGFVNAGQKGVDPATLERVLKMWLDAGAVLGNHSFSHPDLNERPLDYYEADILKGEPVLRKILATRGQRLEFFRHPYLHAGPTEEKRRGLETFLSGHGYRVAPVTFDTADYMYASAFLQPAYSEKARAEYLPYMESVVEFFEQRSVETIGYEIPQILLIHASELNAQFMPRLLAMFRARGYTFVSLDEALKDPAYRLPDSYAGKGGFSWVHRWSITKGIPKKGEPDPPKWLTDLQP